MKRKVIVFGSISIAEADDREKITGIVRSGESPKGAVLINVAPVSQRQSTQIAFAGNPEAVAEALFLVAQKAVELLKLKKKSPRPGVVESALFIPVQGIALGECKLLAKRYVRRLYQELGLPVFYHNYKSYALYRDFVGLIFERGIAGLM